MQTEQHIQHTFARLQHKAAGKGLTHALAFVSQSKTASEKIARQTAQLLLCAEATSPCGHCKSCRLLIQQQHPDLSWIKPEKEEGTLKVDQIRDLQQTAFTSAQLGKARVILLSDAHRLNHSAANALLKLLEEPPAGVYFILLLQTTGTIPLTVLSRCQVYHLPFHEAKADNYLQLPDWADENESMQKVFAQQQQLIQDLQALLAGEETLYTVCSRWQVYELKALVHFLYRLHAMLIYLHYAKTARSVNSQLITLAAQVKPERLFEQLNRINEILYKLNHNIHVNPQLCLENCLLNLLI